MAAARPPVRQNSDGKLPQGLNSITGQGNTDGKENEKMELFCKTQREVQFVNANIQKGIEWFVEGAL